MAMLCVYVDTMAARRCGGPSFGLRDTEVASKGGRAKMSMDGLAANAHMANARRLKKRGSGVVAASIPTGGILEGERASFF